MTNTQVITIRKDGSISGLEHKNGFDFKVLGTVGNIDIKRASEILWNKEIGKWYVEFKDLKKYKFLDYFLLIESSGTRLAYIPPNAIAHFNTYEEAIEAEIKVLNFLRLSGEIE